MTATHRSPDGAQRTGPGAESIDDEHFRPHGTVFILVLFVIALVLLWLSVYVILLSRGVTT